ncbi:Alpha/Beta hydrolase protein [Chytriomyces sp. MP71]|nr:Alpha/Beta hydrolase protein [Chytriomyces sp. MP71]
MQVSRSSASGSLPRVARLSSYVSLRTQIRTVRHSTAAQFASIAPSPTSAPRSAPPPPRRFTEGHAIPTPAAELRSKAIELFHHETPFKLHLGGILPQFDIAYETWGTLNERKDNVILLTTGLSASPHAKSHLGNRKDGWWEKFIGPGLPVDTSKYFVICTNVLGGCFGSTGPSSIDPLASEMANKPVRYGMNFPMVTIWDMMARQIGTITYRSGPEWEVRFGRKRANTKFERNFKPDFMIETYLMHQGKKWQGQYDPNSLLYISRAMDMFDMADRPLRDPNDASALQDPIASNQRLLDLEAEDPLILDEKTQTDYLHTHYLTNGMSTIQCPVLVIGVRSDFLIPSWQQKEIATCLKAAGNAQVTHFELDGVFGHDTFLLDFANVGTAVKGHLDIDLKHPVPGEWHI